MSYIELANSCLTFRPVYRTQNPANLHMEVRRRTTGSAPSLASPLVTDQFPVLSTKTFRGAEGL